MEKDEQIKLFCSHTQQSEERAQFFLEASGWNLQIAEDTYFEQVGSGESVESQAGSKIARLSDYQSSSHGNDEEEGQSFFAGGSEHSGQLITGPPRKKRPEDADDLTREDLVKNVFTAAKSHGAVVAGDEEQQGKPEETFVGAGFRLGDNEGPSEQISGVTPLSQLDEVNMVLYFWKNGFSIDSGSLRSGETPEDKEFLKAVMKGEIPQELIHAARGGKVELTMEDRRNEDYNPPKPKVVVFSGEGHTLGSIVPKLVQQQVATPPATPTTPLDETQPITRLQIKLSDGSRLIGRFNHSHTIASIRAFINQSRTDMASVSYILKTTFPNRELTDESLTLSESNLINAVVVQHLK